MAVIPRTNLGLFLTTTPIIVILVYIVFFLVNEDDGALMGNLVNPILAITAAILAFALYQFTRKSPSPEINLGLVVAFTLLALGELTWSIYAEVLSEDITVSIADFFWLSGYVVLVVVLLQVIRDAKVKISRQIVAIQVAFWLAISPLLIYVVSESYGATDTSTLELVTWNLYTLSDAIILSLVIMLIWSFRKGLLEDCWIIVAVSIAFFTMGDSLYTMYEAWDIYSVGTMPDVFYIGSYAMLSLGFGLLLYSRAKRTSVKPIMDASSSAEGMRELAPRNTYVIWSTDSRRGYELIVQGLSKGLEGLIISRKPPSMIKPTQGLKNTAMIWLTTTPGNEAIHPASTGILTDTIVRFVEKNRNSIILLDGFESIVTHTDFNKALITLDHLKDLVVANNSRLIVTIDKRALTEKEAALIEKKAILVQG